MRRPPAATLFALLALAFMTSVALDALDKWDWPEKPKNLQVLPKDWPGKRLQPVMTGFTRALGVRCSYCHKGEEGRPLSTFDFASDDNPNKNRAREMLRMLEDINGHLKKIDPSGDQRVNMWCNTCHRGRPRPMTLEEELGESYRKNGIQATLDRYTELKTKFYGRGSYDFGENSLNAFGYELLEKDVASAVQIFKLNAREFPDSWNVWDSLGESCAKAGDVKSAKENYEKSLAINPDNKNAREALARLKAASGPPTAQ
jgi:tetratricopeptide (TPR) repeat protein